MVYKKTILIGLIGLLNINTFIHANNKQLKSKKLELAITLHSAIDPYHYGLRPSLSYDSKYLLIYPSPCNPSSIELFDIKTGKLLKTFNNTKFACFSPDGHYLTVSSTQHIKILAIPSCQCIKKIDNLWLPISHWSPNSKHLIISETGYSDNYINKQLLYNLQNNEISNIDNSDFFDEDTMGQRIVSFTNIYWSSDSNYFVRKSKDCILVWHKNQTMPVKLKQNEPSDHYLLYWLLDSNYLITISVNDDSVNLWDAAQGKLLKTLDLSFYKDVYYRTYIICNTHNGDLLIFNGTKLYLHNIFNDKKKTLGAQSGVWTAQWSPNNRYLVTIGNNTKLWDLKTNKLTATLQGTFTSSSGCGYALSNNFLALPSLDGKKLQLFDTHSGKLTEEHSTSTGTLKWSPDGHKLISVSNSEKNIYVWNLVEEK